MGLYDYSLSPNTQQNQGFGAISNYGVPQVQVPQMSPVNYSLGQSGAMPIAGMNGGTGLTMSGNSSDYSGMNTWGKDTANIPSAGFGMNMPTFALGLQGLNSLGSLYMGAKSLDLANKQFESSQKFANINLANQTHSYNDTLAQRINRIGSREGTSKAELDAELSRRKLPAAAV